MTMGFLHHGIPRRTLKGIWTTPNHPEPEDEPAL